MYVRGILAPSIGVEHLRRRWAHRRLRRGQCQWCRSVLPDSIPLVRGRQVCSPACLDELCTERIVFFQLWTLT
jgi:hypothetical protein